MDYKIQRLKEDLTNAQRRNKNQRKQLANYKNAYDKKFKENVNLKKALIDIREVINGEKFFLLMNSETNTHYCSKDKVVCEDYFKGKKLISQIIDKVLGDER